MKKLLPGVVILAAITMLTVIVGFYIGFNTEQDVTLKVMLTMFVYPTPYVLLAVIATALFHSKRWPPLVYTFTVGAIALTVSWLLNNVVWLDYSIALGEALEQSLLFNFYVSAAISVVFIVVLIVESHIAWPSENVSN